MIYSTDIRNGNNNNNYIIICTIYDIYNIFFIFVNYEKITRMWINCIIVDYYCINYIKYWNITNFWN